MSNWGPVLELAKLFKPVLAGIDSVVHDWGIAVILLTLIVRICLFPLSIRQARFGYKNRAFTKAYREVQQTHKHDPDKLKEAAKQLTLEHKFNPFSMVGTMVLQMPIFAAVYAVFYHFGNDIHTVLLPWAEALSQSDSTHALPFLVGGLSAVGAMVPLLPPENAGQLGVLPKLLPMLMVFPMMLFFLWKAPVAIGLYMATSSLWGMLERRFLRTPFALRKFRLEAGLAKPDPRMGELRRFGETGDI